MYDFEILVPAETASPTIMNRLTDFRRWGLFNIPDDVKVKVVLAASVGNNPNLINSGWHKNIDAEVLMTPYSHVAQRTYYYYSEYIKPNTAKWYIRIDEDSLTDIGALKNNLELMFDHEKDFHLTGETNFDIQEIDYSILVSLGYSWWYNDDVGPEHEFEISITSMAAMNRILQNENAKKYFKLRKEFAVGFGDHGLAHAARMEKIYPKCVRFLTWNPDLLNFSRFSGRFNHIHHTAKDITPCVLSWLEMISDCAENPFRDEKFLFCRKNQNEKKWVSLNDNGCVMFGELEPKFNLQRIGLWDLTRDGKLTIFHHDHGCNTPLIIFEKINDSLYESVNFELKKI